MIALAHKEKTMILEVNLIFRRDPTRTLGIQSRFVREVNARFRRLKGDVRRSIVDNDCFGLTDRLILVGEAARPRQFAFARTSDKVRAFMDWLNRQEEMGILEVIRRPGRAISIEEAWIDKYILSAYQKGMQRGRSELAQAGWSVASYDQIPGGVASAAFLQPTHADRIGALFTRVFEELKGIDAAMDQRISRVLTQGLLEGRSPRRIAQILNKQVDGLGRTRTRMLARTEVVRAHTMAVVQEYREAGIVGVTVQAEWATAGFNVCPDCADMQGRILTLEEVEQAIPLHPH